MGSMTLLPNATERGPDQAVSGMGNSALSLNGSSSVIARQSKRQASHVGHLRVGVAIVRGINSTFQAVGSDKLTERTGRHQREHP